MARIVRLSAAVAVLAAMSSVVIAAPDEPGGLFGVYAGTVDGLDEPQGVAIRPDGGLVVAEAAFDRVRLVSVGNASLAELGADADFRAPQGVAVDGTGRVYVADTGHDRIVRLAFDGSVDATWAPKDLDLRRPEGVAVRDGTVAVADTGNRRVVLLDESGTTQAVLGRDADLARPRAVALDDAGRVIVADAGRHRIVILGRDGAVAKAWGEWGAFPGLFSQPTAVAWHAGRIYVADRLGHRIQVFDRDGAFVGQWGRHAVVPREGEGRIHYPSGLAIAPDGSFAVVAEAFEDRVQRFTPGAPPDTAPLGPPARGGQSHFGPHLAVGGHLLAVTEPEAQSLTVFDLDPPVPVMITRFGEPGPRPAQHLDLVGVTFDTDGGEIVTTDPVLRQVQWFGLRDVPPDAVRYDPRLARFVRGWMAPKLRAGSSGPAIAPTGAVTCADHTVLLIDRRIDGLQRFGATGAWIERVGRDIEPPLARPVDLAADPSRDRLYVADAWTGRIVVLDSSGAQQAAWGGDPAAPFQRPVGVAVLDDGSIVVSDRARHMVTRLDVDGAVLGRWGGRGMEQGRFWQPGGVAVDGQGRVFVVDVGNHRIQAFDRAGAWLMTFSAGRAYTRETEARP